MASVMTYRDGGVQTGVAIKAPVMVATTGNVQLSGLQTIDGVTLAELDRVLVRAQSSAVQNGVYVVRSTAWQRAKDFDGPRDIVQGTRIPVVQGTTYAGQDFVVTNSGQIIVDTTELTFKNQAIFSDVYLGPLDSDPATRNDGTALQEGDFYLNTSSGLRVYTSGDWAATIVSASSFAATLLDDTSAAEARGTLGAEAIDADILRADVSDNLEVGYTTNTELIGNSGTGTVTPNLTTPCFKEMTINGSFTLAPPSSGNGACAIYATTDGTGGYTVTTSGYTSVVGAYDNTAGLLHRFYIEKVGLTSRLTIELIG